MRPPPAIDHGAGHTEVQESEDPARDTQHDGKADEPPVPSLVEGERHDHPPVPGAISVRTAGGTCRSSETVIGG